MGRTRLNKPNTQRKVDALEGKMKPVLEKEKMPVHVFNQLKWEEKMKMLLPAFGIEVDFTKVAISDVYIPKYVRKAERDLYQNVKHVGDKINRDLNFSPMPLRKAKPAKPTLEDSDEESSEEGCSTTPICLRTRKAKAHDPEEAGPSSDGPRELESGVPKEAEGRRRGRGGHTSDGAAVRGPRATDVPGKRQKTKEAAKQDTRKRTPRAGGQINVVPPTPAPAPNVQQEDWRHFLQRNNLTLEDVSPEPAPIIKLPILPEVRVKERYDGDKEIFQNKMECQIKRCTFVLRNPSASTCFNVLRMLSRWNVKGLLSHVAKRSSFPTHLKHFFQMCRRKSMALTMDEVRAAFEIAHEIEKKNHLYGEPEAGTRTDLMTSGLYEDLTETLRTLGFVTVHATGKCKECNFLQTRSSIYLGLQCVKQLVEGEVAHRYQKCPKCRKPNSLLVVFCPCPEGFLVQVDWEGHEFEPEKLPLPTNLPEMLTVFGADFKPAVLFLHDSQPSSPAGDFYARAETSPFRYILDGRNPAATPVPDPDPEFSITGTPLFALYLPSTSWQDVKNLDTKM